jgi:hypothetical protein
MTSWVRVLLVAAAVLAVAAAASLLFRTGPPPEVAEPLEPAAVAPRPDPADRAEPRVRVPPSDAVPGAAIDEPPAEATTASTVPHRVLRQVHRDAVQDGTRPHRMLVVVVEPEISTRDLELLARDLRDAHRDAAVLDVRIYDAEQAAREGSIREAQHRVAEVRRNPRLELDVIRIRGVTVEP